MKSTNILFFLFFSFLCHSQNDTIFLNNKKIICTITEISPKAVKFNYPNESISNSIYKNTIKSISYGSGRTQTFNEATSYKTIDNVNEYFNVSITRVENEVNGLFKLGEVSSKAVGTTIFSNQEQIKERAYKKLKIQAAFQGGNIIYLTDQRTQGHKSGFFESSKAETNLTGVLYTTELANFTDFKKLIGDTKVFTAIQENELKNSSFDMSQSKINNKFVIEDLTNENGIIMIIGKLEGARKQSVFKVVSFDKTHFNIFYDGKRAEYNIKIEI